jgi:hypothetical protein
MGGFIRKITGVDQQIEAANRNADAQISATRQTAMSQQSALMSQAKATADQQKALSERAKAEATASSVATQSNENVDVLVGGKADNSLDATKKRRATFGTGYNSPT